MKVLVFGATGPTGRLLVQQALEQGHVVTAFARNPATMTIQHGKLTVMRGDILDVLSIDAAMVGQEAVLSTLGVRKLRKNTTLSDGTKNIIAAMQRHGVKRLVCMTMLGVGGSKDQPAWFFRKVFAPLFLWNIFAEKELQERYVRESDLGWIIVRPAGLINGPRTGVYKVWVGPLSVSIRRRISRADVADFMLQQLTDDTYLRQTPGLLY